MNDFQKLIEEGLVTEQEVNGGGAVYRCMSDLSLDEFEELTVPGPLIVDGDLEIETGTEDDESFCPVNFNGDGISIKNYAFFYEVAVQFPANVIVGEDLKVSTGTIEHARVYDVGGTINFVEIAKESGAIDRLTCGGDFHMSEVMTDLPKKLDVAGWVYLNAAFRDVFGVKAIKAEEMVEYIKANGMKPRPGRTAKPKTRQ